MTSTLRREPKTIWITWEQHRRTRELSRTLGATLFELTSSRPRFVRYIVLLARTVQCIVDVRPAVVIVQCPSLVLALWAGVLKHVLRFTLIIDLHTEAVCPFVWSFPLYRTMMRLDRRAADIGLVTNDRLKEVVERTGGRALVLPDRVPDLTAPPPPGPQARPQAVFVCTYAPDEPYREVMEAARALESTVTIHVTGDYRPVKPDLPPSPARLTGFLTEADYIAFLGRADLIIDLTAMEDCLVCGAYEAVALEKPLVTSDTRALRDYFRRGTVYTKHDCESLITAIQYALAHKDRLALEMNTLKEELASEWRRQHEAVRRMLASMTCRSAVSDRVGTILKDRI